jgi:uncharacterized tellurite resistance protein B-like protein
LEWIVAIVIVLLVLGWLGQRTTGKAANPTSSRSRRDGPSQPSRSRVTISYGSRGRGAALGPDEAADGDRLWQPPGEAVTLQGSVIKAGMVYVGSGLHALNGDGAEPALLDPKLKVDATRVDWTGSGLDYWPSYSTIPPRSRAAYLAWLGRDRPLEPIPLGYVFLFFYGLERRVLLDARHLPPAAAEVPLIRREVARLLSAFGDNRSFGSYASEFLGAIDVLFPDPDAPIAVPAEKSWQLPLDLRLRLGRLVAGGEPIGAELALAWALSAPDIYLRTPATRCADEFAALFLARYRQRHGDGLVIKEPHRRLELHYRPASASFGGPVKLPTGDLPDVSGLTAPVARLRELVDECTDELDAYSRWLGRNRAPSAVVAAALLPPEAIDGRGGGAVEGLRARLEERLGDAPMTTIDADELLRLWPETREGKLDKPGAVLLAQLLDRLGLGIEPDVRFGGPILDADGAVVLFREGQDAPAAPSPSYTSSTVVARLGMAIASADGTVSEQEIAGIEAQLSRVLDLSPTETTRLAAHLHWLRSARPAMTGLKKRLADLSTTQRDELGSFLIAIAGADGYIGPNEVAALGRLYGILGLDPQSVFSHVHAFATGGGAASPAPAHRTDAGGVTLDMDRVQATLQETHAVSALLSDVFVDAEPETSEPPLSGPGIAGLDSAHSELLRRLRGRAAIPRADFDDEARRLRLLPDGALDTINDAAFDQVGMAIAVGDDPLEVDTEALEEMLA